MDNKEGWSYKETVEHYLKVANVLVPGRKEILSIIARLGTTFVSEQPKVLDLGCGAGEVTLEVLKLKPHASACLVDFSDEMIRLSSERFKDNVNIRIVKHDLNNGISNAIAEEKFDVVVSCFAIHHVEFTNRIKLYSDIKKVLREDGLFINGDRFRGNSPVIHQWEFDNWIAWMVQQIKEKFGKEKTFDEIKQGQIESDKKLGDKPGTIWDMERDLREAGFRHVDCLWEYQNLAVIAATK